MEASLLCTDFEHQALNFAVPNDYKETLLSKSSLSYLSQNTTTFTGVKKSSYGFNASFNRMKTQQASNSAPSTVKIHSKPPQKNKTSDLDSSKCSKGKRNILPHPLFLDSTVLPPKLTPSSKPDLNGDDSLTSQLSTENFQNKPQLTSLYMVSTTHNFQKDPNCFNDHYILYSSMQIAP